MYVLNRKEHIIQGLLLRSIELLQIILQSLAWLITIVLGNKATYNIIIIKKAINEHVD